MATDLLFEQYTDEEYSILDKATDDFYDHGYSAIICPRCGNNFDFSQRGNSYQIKCKTDDCLELTFRGV